MQVFLVILAGQTLSGLGSQLTDFSLNVWIFQETGSAVRFALGILASAVPRMLLAPLAGALIDRWDRKAVMIACDSVLAARTLTVLVLLAVGRLAPWHVIFINAVGSVFGGFHSTAWSASRILLVPKRHLARVNGLSSALGSAAGLLAPALAGALFVVVGIRGIAAIDLASWALAILPLLIVKIPRPEPIRPEAGPRRLSADIRDGWRYLRSMGGLVRLLFFYSAVGFVGVSTEVLLGPYVLSFGNAAGYGLVQSAGSLGFLVGGLALAIAGSPARIIWMVIASETVICACGAMIGAFPILWAVAPLMFVYLATVAFCDGTIATLWQRKVDPAFQGRVFSLKDAVATALMPIGVLIFSPIAEYWLEPNLSAGGAWAAGLGRIVGTGPGRGMGLLFLVSNLTCVPIIMYAVLSRRLRRVDTDLPDRA